MNVTNLRQQIENCARCPLRAKIAKDEIPYFGVGSNNPKIMLVISPPSKEFSQLVEGLSLEYLEQNLKKWNISKSDVYITPFVKCRTSSVTKTSVNKCQQWLDFEIELFKPKAIFLIGSHTQVKMMNVNDAIIIPHSLYELATNSGTKKSTDYLFSEMSKFLS